MPELLLPFGVALALGLLVGFQRERTKPGLGGVRTFPLITLVGAACALLARELGSGWVVAAGLLALGALVVMGNILQLRHEEVRGGLTTEVAILVMYLVGALAVAGFVPLAVVLGGVVAVLLHFKRPMHGFARRITDEEVRVLMRIVLVGLVILPALPDETYGPYHVLNPFRIWLMVVLIVGISVASYVVYRLVGARTGTLVGGVLGGLISSTATTASYARRARASKGFAPVAAAVVMVASTVIFLRIFVEIAAVAPSLLAELAPPLGTMMGVNVVLSALGLARVRTAAAGRAPDREDPTELRTALVFGALYGVVLFAVAAAKEHFGDLGLFVVATLSGLTDVDAITLSMANLAAVGRLDVATAWRAILLAALANLVFKGALALSLGGMPMLRAVGSLFGPSLVAGVAILALWP